jgi:hypothetical protein
MISGKTAQKIGMLFLYFVVIKFSTYQWYEHTDLLL